MIALRVLSEEGTGRFREYIHSLKEHPAQARPQLDSASDSLPFGKYIEIDEAKHFSSRLEIAEYLSSIFKHAGLSRGDVMQSNGMWTWLAYVWFDIICPRVYGIRKARESAKYICSSDYRDYYRHYIAAAYDIYSVHGKNNSRLFLECSPNLHNDFVEQLASRQFIINNTRLVELAHRLFWDNRANRAKQGSTDRKKPGTLRRLVKVIGQLELTYDIHSMEAKNIMDLLPQEFKLWTN